MRELIVAVCITSYLVFGFFFWRWALKQAWGAEIAEDKPFNYAFAFFCIGYSPIVIFVALAIWGGGALIDIIVDYQMKKEKVEK